MKLINTKATQASQASQANHIQKQHPHKI